MEIKVFEEKLSELENNSVAVTGQNTEEDFFSILIVFSQGATLRADYWRIIKDGKHFLSSFDHKQKYGLPAPVNAIERTKEEIEGKSVCEVKFEKETGDLIFKFTNDLKLQILNFSAYEVWEVNFADGSGEYSNYVR